MSINYKEPLSGEGCGLHEGVIAGVDQYFVNLPESHFVNQIHSLEKAFKWRAIEM